MNAALFGTIGAALVAAISAIITTIISRRGAQNAAEAANDAALMKIAFDGLNATNAVLVRDQDRIRVELENVRKKCNILGRNENKMRGLIQRRMPEEFESLNLEVVPNGYA